MGLDHPSSSPALFPSAKPKSSDTPPHLPTAPTRPPFSSSGSLGDNHSIPCKQLIRLSQCSEPSQHLLTTHLTSNHISTATAFIHHLYTGIPSITSTCIPLQNHLWHQSSFTVPDSLLYPDTPLRLTPPTVQSFKYPHHHLMPSSPWKPPSISRTCYHGRPSIPQNHSWIPPRL